MNVPISWLNDYVDLRRFSIEDIVDAFTNLGYEVENTIDLVKSNTNIHVGQVLLKRKLENSNKLNYCDVMTGPKTIHKIICGADNFDTGDKVVVALDGAELSCGLKIAKRTIMDTPSEGMICSFKEIGLTEDSLSSEEKNGIIVLPKTSQLESAHPLEYIGLHLPILDISFTPNRNYAQSIFILARELSVYFNIPCRAFSFQKPTFNNNFVATVEPTVAKAFQTILVKDVIVKESPNWLKNKLRAAGFNSINNIVDLTNYIMLELGQPLHAYDAQKVNGSFYVRNAKKGEVFFDLKGKRFSLTPTDVVVSDNEKLLCLAGVVGSNASAVSFDSTNIIVEAATWYGEKVRKTANKHSIVTDSSQLYSRSIAVIKTNWALNRFLSIIISEKWATNASTIKQHFYSADHRCRTVVTSEEYKAVIGQKLNITGAFNRLMKANHEVSILPEGIGIKAALERIDLVGKIEMIEEIARLEKYSKIIPFEVSNINFEKNTFYDICSSEIPNYFSNNGFSNVKTYTLVTEQYGELNPFDYKKPPLITNYISENNKSMRRTMMPSMIEILNYNKKQGIEDVHIHEVGQVFNGKKNVTHLAFLSKGNILSNNLYGKKWSYDYYDYKEIVSHLLTNKIFNLDARKIKFIGGVDFKYFHPLRTVKIEYKNNTIGFIGVISKKIIPKIAKETVYCEINLDALSEHSRNDIKYLPIDVFPVVKRSFSFIVPKNIVIGDIREELTKNKNVKNFNIFDLIHEGQFKGDEKSLSFNVDLDGVDHTLDTKEADKIQNWIIRKLKEKFGCILRRDYI